MDERNNKSLMIVDFSSIWEKLRAKYTEVLCQFKIGTSGQFCFKTEQIVANLFKRSSGQKQLQNCSGNSCSEVRLKSLKIYLLSEKLYMQN